jgi:hypothetical protein
VREERAASLGFGGVTERIHRAGGYGVKGAPEVAVLIKSDGSIERGGQNLPGGNWESKKFNLADALKQSIPSIGDHETMIVIHNDAVVQGLSEVPFMRDVSRWGVATIGTGLGNARFTNRTQSRSCDK